MLCASAYVQVCVIRKLRTVNMWVLGSIGQCVCMPQSVLGSGVSRGFSF